MKKTRSDRLIDAAAVILGEMRRPATAREIIARVQKSPSLKTSVSGKTPHKTLNARLSVDIIKYGEKSQFYRFGPASYGLRDALSHEKYDRNFRKVYIGNNRRKAVSNEPVATIMRQALKFFATDGLYESGQYPLKMLNFLDVRYTDRKFAETCEHLTQLVSYAYIYHEDAVLAFEKGRYTSDDGEFIGR